MSLIIATGSNLGDKKENLKKAKDEISKIFKFIAESEVFVSEAVDYQNQPDFYNQVLEYEVPNDAPKQVLNTLLKIENKFGRVRNIDKGPRTVDIDIIFWGLDSINVEGLTIPHVSWANRSFIVRPMQQLPFFQSLKKCFRIPSKFKVEAKPIK